MKEDAANPASTNRQLLIGDQKCMEKRYLVN